MKQKAFTLVELLSVIVLLGLIAVILIPNFSGILKTSTNDLYEKQVSVIKTAAKLWTTDKENKIFLINNKEWPYVITIGDLQSSNLLDENIKNPKTDELFSDSTLIYINYENNQYTFEVDENTIAGSSQIIKLVGDKDYKLEVNTNYVELGFSALDLNGNDITSSVITTIYENGLPIDNIDTTSLNNYTIKYSVSYKDNDGSDKTAIAFRRIRVVDTTAPIITCSSCTNNTIVFESTDRYTLPTVIATDNYDISVSVLKIGSFSSIIPGERKITFLATDSSGNSSSVVINFIVRDTIAPVIESIDEVKGTNGYITYTITASDSGSGIKEYSIDGGKTWQKSNQFIVPLNNIIRSFLVKDNAGNISSNQQKEEIVFEFNYTGNYEEFIVPKTGYYKIEAWGASGGYATSNTYAGGYGGYSTGLIYLEKDEVLYINVGGQGMNSAPGTIATYNGGYNGGGNGYVHRTEKGSSGAGGGGATHIATESGILSELSTYESVCRNQSSTCPILIVSGGGGGAFKDTDSNGYAGIGGSGGGFEGTSAKQTGACTYDCTRYSYPSGGTQVAGGLGVTLYSTGATSKTEYAGAFGQGATGTSTYGGGGGGFYGGGSGNYVAGGGGSGYIGNPLLEEKYMYCYNCTTSDETATKTYTTENVSDTAVSDYAKSGNGYAKIEYIDGIFKVNVETIKKFGNTDVTIDIKSSADLSDNNKYQYYISTSNTELVGGSWRNYTPGETFTIAKATGIYYLWIYPISDVEGKIADNKIDINTPYVKQEIAINGTITYDYTGNYEEFIASVTGYYNIELWGAQGSFNSVSKGAYTKGKVLLEKNEKVYIYVGASGANATNSVNFNGGKADNGGTNGGGATDIRYFGEYTPTESELLWNSSLGLKSRIMVAGGSGAGSGNNTVSKGAGGTLTGKAGGGTQGGTQTTFGAVQNAAFAASSFGIANGGCSGGNGYYPGGGASCASGAGGGSSFISGYTGCVAITSSTDLTPKARCTDGTTDIECSYHYSGKIFEETLMIAGDAEMPTHDGTSTMVGNSGDGYAKITYIGN